VDKKLQGSKNVKFSYEGIDLEFEFDITETTMSSEITQSQVWEPWQLKLYSNLLKKENAVFVDVGANVGVNSIFAKARNPNARVIAIEPDPNNVLMLQKNVQKAKLEIEVHPIAISDRNGYVSMVGDKTHGHIANENDPYGKFVDSLQLDELILQASLSSIQLLKIDVEGYTDLVLSFSKRTLKITECAIVEFSLNDLDLRFQGDADVIRRNIEKDFNTLTTELKNVYYISRSEGLVNVKLTEFIEVLLVESTVGDFLFSRIPQTSVSVEIFLLRKIRTLQKENHLRILESQNRAHSENLPQKIKRSRVYTKFIGQR
jgi:FkbM family methyltransferase